MTKLTTASVLAFERNLDISDAFFWQANSQDENQPVKPVTIVEKSVRGTISNRLKNAIANDVAKLDAETEKANLQKVDAAALDVENDTLIARWSCKVLPFDGKPNVCNDQDYQLALEAVVQGYIHEHGLAELAKRYATNIVNARWLWRNRVGAESIEVTIKCDDEVIYFNDAKQFALNNFESNDVELQKLSNLIEQGLLGKAFVILYIEAKAVVGFGQEVFPSQELILDTGKTKSKVLYQVNGKAGMHSQKVGNAIRTIDTWYNDAEFPIAIEPYGAVTTMGKAFRQPKQKQDFYSLFDNWILKGEKPETEQQHYVMAVLIRGGVFGASGKE
ncbi:type I-F CRISPR-associated protein Csy3 [Aliidiomarina taiwanensis]|uniref:Type I-F CRISPR-associated protein Csy3 n=1 Tax=Aliidiomarina taiwanensis TaxID=946228 RepID=A0A432X7D8_9GAMM|nr:type I-F CRISPR-associated protein Csy3 [Aliidiomarina taiwanensis]RUO42768.1 type I-F CRISPR-associated protein Csy3 [Aliidiomarina taiwanensis]